MRYLYGDSTPFPHGSDFLATLEAFMTSATRVVMLSIEGEREERELNARAQSRINEEEALQTVHRSVTTSLNRVLDPNEAGPRGTLGADEPSAIAVEYVTFMKDTSASFLQEKHRRAKDATTRESAELRTHSEKRIADARGALETFFKTARLQTLSARATAVLRETKYELGLVTKTAGEVTTAFRLSTAKTPAWHQPRKVSDFMQGVDLMVGSKKALFKSTITPEVVHLDEFVVSKIDVHSQGAELCLRKRADQKDMFVFHLQRTDKGTRGKVDRPQDPNAAALPSELSPEDTAKIERIVKAAGDAVSALSYDRETVLRLELDGKEIAGGLGLSMVQRLINVFGPIVEDIASRSPSDTELSLKIEHDSGKREEMYLRRDELLKKLQPLSAQGRAIFAPLGLDDWVPTLTLRPPDIIELDETTE